MLSSILLVLATAGALAILGHALGLSWPVAWVLGAVVAPTDATAVASVAGRLPRRSLTILPAESLINDGTALVVFAIAVQAATGEREFGWGSAVARFGLSYLGGAAAGLLVAWLATRARRIVREPLLENGISVLTPFAAYLIAEEVHASGVLAVVASGLALSQSGPRLVSARTRLQARAFWQLTTFLLNGTLFVLVGLQLRSAVQNLVSYSLAEAARDALLVAAAVITTRLIWYYTVPYIIRVLDRRPQQRLMTLLVQGLTLPAVLRWAQLPDDGAEAQEQQLAERTATRAGLAALPAAAARLEIPPAVAERVRADYEEHLRNLADPDDLDVEDANGRAAHEAYERLRAALLADKRVAVVRLRDAGRIDDIVLRRVQARLDAEEARLAVRAGLDDD